MWSTIRNYLTDWLLWLDEGVNTLFAGDPGESVSVASAKARNQGKRWGCVMCKFLNIFQADHCDKALANFDKHSLRGD